MTELPSETLRRAAEKLRALAQAASEGPWGHASDGAFIEVYGHNRRWVADAGRSESKQARHDGAFIATLHPGVAVLIADWLDAEAGAHEGGMGITEAVRDLVAVVETRERDIQVAVSTLGQALAVARALLGEESL